MAADAAEDEPRAAMIAAPRFPTVSQNAPWSQAVSFGGSLEEKAKQLDAVTARLQSLSPDDPEREKLEKTRDAMEIYIEFYGNR